MHITTPITRPNGVRRTPWLVWLMAGILIALNLGPVRMLEPPLEPRLALLGFRLAIVGALAQDLGGRFALLHRFSRVPVRLFALCAATGTLALPLGVAGSQAGAALLETGVSGVMTALEWWVAVATAGALVCGLLRLMGWAWFGLREPASPQPTKVAEAPEVGARAPRR